MRVELPAELRAEVQDLVAQGEFPDEAAAVVALVRVGLSYRYRRTPAPAMPLERREPPGPRGPGLPPDVTWIP
jgi:Arc/MetJ-type ribon-helix-helix transcriptional regulator